MADDETQGGQATALLTGTCLSCLRGVVPVEQWGGTFKCLRCGARIPDHNVHREAE